MTWGYRLRTHKTQQNILYWSIIITRRVSQQNACTVLKKHNAQKPTCVQCFRPTIQEAQNPTEQSIVTILRLTHRKHPMTQQNWRNIWELLYLLWFKVQNAFPKPTTQCMRFFRTRWFYTQWDVSRELDGDCLPNPALRTKTNII